MCYCKIPTITPELIFVQNAFFAGLIFGKLIFGEAKLGPRSLVGKWAKKSLSEVRGLLLEGNRKRPKLA